MSRLLTDRLERRLLAAGGRPITLRRKRKAGERREGEPPDDPKKADQGDDADRDDGPGTLVGYASVFHREDDPGTEYELYADRYVRAVERVAQGCFRDALERPDDVRATFNHSDDLILGRSSSGTLRMEEDETGLRYEVDLPDTQAARDLAELVDRGDVTGSSFGFRVERESWREEDDGEGRLLAIRTLESVRLEDVGPVTYPAYASASTGRSVRALGSVEEVRESYRRWKESRGAALPLQARLAQIRSRHLHLQRQREQERA